MAHALSRHMALQSHEGPGPFPIEGYYRIAGNYILTNILIFSLIVCLELQLTIKARRGPLLGLLQV